MKSHSGFWCKGPSVGRINYVAHEISNHYMFLIVTVTVNEADTWLPACFRSKNWVQTDSGLNKYKSVHRSWGEPLHLWKKSSVECCIVGNVVHWSKTLLDSLRII